MIVPVPENDIGNIKEGVMVGFTVPAFPHRTFSGKVARVSHAVDAKTRTMPVELDVMNVDGKLTPGTFSEVLWPLKRQSALLVPSTAIATNLERTFVVRVRDGKTEWVDVKRGIAAEKLVEVLGDLKEGDIIAVRGTDEVPSGIAVVTR